MTLTNIVFVYDGVWKTNEQRVWESCPKSNAGMGAINIDVSNVTILEIVEKICEKCNLNKDEIELKMSYLPPIRHFNPLPIYLDNSNCLKAFFCFGDMFDRPLLHIEFLKRNQSAENLMGILGRQYDNDTVIRPLIEEEEEDLGGPNVVDSVDVDATPDNYFQGKFLENNIVDVCFTGTSRAMMIDENVVDEHLNEENINEDVNNEITKSPQLGYHRYEPLDDDDKNLPLLGCGNSETYSYTDGSNLSIGQEFENKAEVQIKLKNIAMDASFEMRVLKSTKTLYSVRCVDDKCSWRVRATQIKSSIRFSIRTYCNKHTCDLLSRKRNHRQASSAIVANMLVENFRGQQSTPTPKAIRTMMQNKGVEISYFKAWKGKQIAINQLRGDPVESFKLLPAYLYVLQQVNPGTTTHLEINSDGSFKYLFLAYKACIIGFKCMRKVIIVDGTFLKSRYKGVLLIATAQDGNRHQYPIAWAIVDTETEASWTWFFQKLCELIPDDNELVFISDRHQGIINAVGAIYKQAQHGHCMWHIIQNIKTRLKAGLEGAVKLFMQTAKAYKQSEFDKLYNELGDRYPPIAAYLENNIDREKWSRAYFPSARYNIMTSNGAESINARLRSARELPIIALLDAIQDMVFTWFNRHCIDASALNISLTPWAEKTIRKRFIESQKMSVSQLNAHEYRVTGLGHDSTVNLCRKTCSCRVFDIDRLPCAHAIAAHKTGVDVYNLCSHYYTSATWALAYSETIYPVPLAND